VPLDFNTTVAILNWNGLHHLKTYLPSVVEYSKGAIILLIDNASTDESINWVRGTYPEIEIVINPSNKGFTIGYNLGLKAVMTKYAILLNSDVEVSPNWLEPLVSRMESDKNIAACQPKILSFKDKSRFEYAGASGGFIDFLGYPFCRGRLFDFCEVDRGQYDKPIEVFWVTGASMMVRMEAFLSHNGLEEHFFAHMEEIDLCWRWQHAGYSLWVEPQSVVYHLGGGTLKESSPRKTFLNFRNGLTLLFINTLDNKIFWKIPVRLILDGIAGIMFLSKGQVASCFAIVRAHFSFYGKLRYWLTKRKDNKQRFRKEVDAKLVFSKSIVFSFFIKRIKEFNHLGF